MRRIALLFLSSLTLLSLLSACGTKSQLALHGATPAAGTRPAAPAGNPGASRSTLRLIVPALAALKPGAEFAVTLSADTVEPLFQASARLGYDSSQLEPISAQRGAGLPASSVFLCSTDKPVAVMGTGIASTAKAVPFAFTGLPSQGGIPAGTLELVTVRFRLKQGVTGDAGLRLVNDPQYLQLRSSDGRRIAFDLASEVGTK